MGATVAPQGAQHESPLCPCRSARVASPDRARLQPWHVRLIPAAADGPNGLAPNPLDRYLFGEWLRRHARRGLALHTPPSRFGAFAVNAASRRATEILRQRMKAEPLPLSTGETLPSVASSNGDKA